MNQICCMLWITVHDPAINYHAIVLHICWNPICKTIASYSKLYALPLVDLMVTNSKERDEGSLKFEWKGFISSLKKIEHTACEINFQGTVLFKCFTLAFVQCGPEDTSDTDASSVLCRIGSDFYYKLWYNIIRVACADDLNRKLSLFLWKSFFSCKQQCLFFMASNSASWRCLVRKHIGISTDTYNTTCTCIMTLHSLIMYGDLSQKLIMVGEATSKQQFLFNFLMVSLLWVCGCK